MVGPSAIYFPFEWMTEKGGKLLNEEGEGGNGLWCGWVGGGSREEGGGEECPHFTQLVGQAPVLRKDTKPHSK